MPGKIYSAVKDLLIDTKGMLVEKWRVPLGMRAGKNDEQHHSPTNKHAKHNLATHEHGTTTHL